MAACSVAYLESTPLLDAGAAEESGGGAVIVAALLQAAEVLPLLTVDRKLPLETLEAVRVS